jgi:hypothetical protein
MKAEVKEIEMSAARPISHGKSGSRSRDAGGGVFILRIDRAKMIRDLLEVINNPDRWHERKN